MASDLCARSTKNALLDRSDGRLALEGVFVDQGFGTQMQLRWAEDAKGPYEARDIGPLDKFYVDVLSVGDQHNKVFVKWPQDVAWLAHQALFEEPSIYRLSIIATSTDGTTSEIKLGFLWFGFWDKTEMWVDEEINIGEMAERLKQHLAKCTIDAV